MRRNTRGGKKSKNKPRGYWNDIQNWRSYFRDFAASKGFDPLRIENWVDIHTADVVDLQGSGPLAKTNSSLRLALLKAFPELNAQVAINGMWFVNPTTMRKNDKA